MARSREERLQIGLSARALPDVCLTFRTKLPADHAGGSVERGGGGGRGGGIAPPIARPRLLVPRASSPPPAASRSL